jgi:hypothetical protein
MTLNFRGYYTGSSEDSGFKPPIFRDDAKIIVLDIDGVLLIQKGRYRRGVRRGNDTYRLHNQAMRIFEHAKMYFDRTVLWSFSEYTANLLTEICPFNDADLIVVGQELEHNEPVKRLEILSSNLNNIVAIEDGLPRERTVFRPPERVVSVGLHHNLMNKYFTAWKKVHTTRK